MAPSSDMTIEAAADMVAVMARIGCSRLQKQAMSNGMTGALVGGGLGLGAGLLSSATSEEKRKRWLQNSLMGAGLGAAAGGALGYGSDWAGNISEDSPLDKITKSLEKAKNEEIAQRPPVTDPVGSFVNNLWNGNGGGEGGFNPADAKAIREAGGNPEAMRNLAPGAWSAQDSLGEYAGRPVTTAATAGLGAGAGAMIDRARMQTPGYVSSLSADAVKKMQPGDAELVNKFKGMANTPGAVVRSSGLAGGGVPSVEMPTANAPLSQSLKGSLTRPTVSWQPPENNWRTMQSNAAKYGPRRFGATVAGGLFGGVGAPLLARAFGAKRPMPPQAPAQ